MLSGGSKMNTNKTLLNYLKDRPKLYEPSSAKFWDDEHISKGMLEAHLNPEVEAATRKLDFVDRSASWITSLAMKQEYTELLDLGCGPGIYAERFYKKGFRVTGIDLSHRSVDYARASAKQKNLHIFYLCQNYLELDYQEQFDVVTLIYCDFGVLSDADRNSLLKRIFRTLKPGGTLIFDVFTPNSYKDVKESKNYSYQEGGFWNKNPHLCFDLLYRYDECNTFLHQYVISTAASTQCYNVWEHTFTVEELERDLKEAGFGAVNFYGDVAGAALMEASDTICVAAGK
jgi:2-polyprenyl-3-methyl-5-hydroxy-6-metoxy-1,4-benzoquinol methylase